MTFDQLIAFYAVDAVLLLLAAIAEVIFLPQRLRVIAETLPRAVASYRSAP